MNYTRDPCERTLLSESFIAEELTVCIKPNELEALIKSPKLTVKTETVGVCDQHSVCDQHNSLMEEFSTSIASFWVKISLLLIWATK